MNEPRNTRTARILPWFIVAVPVVLLLLYVWTYRVNGAEWDHLASTNVFALYDTHAFTFHFLFQQHNEHRIAVPRLVILGLGLLTRWNNEAEMFAHAALMCATAAVLFGAFRREPGAPPSRERALFAFVPAVLIALSPRSYEALTGFGLPHYLEILFYVVALRLLVFGAPTWIRFAAAALCGEAATFSVANGLWIWPLGLAVILSQLGRESRSRTLVRAGVWAVVSTVTILAYFHNYLPTGNHASASFFAEHPLVALEHFVVLNGTVFAASVTAAAAFGTIALGLYAWVAARVARDWMRSRERPPYGLWLIVSAVGSNATITAGRAIFGPAQALDSRYAAMIALAPIGLYWCVLVRRQAWRVSPWLTRGIAAMMIAGYAIVSIQTWAAAPEWYSRKKEMAYLLYSMPDQADSEVLRLYPIVGEARWFGAQLERLHLNVFADAHVDPRDLAPTQVRPALRIETINGRPRTHDAITIGLPDPVEVRGYAFNGAGNGPAGAMFLTIDGRIDVPAVTGLYRAGAKPEARWAGFAASSGGFLLTPGEHTLALKIVADDGRHAYVTDPVATIVRR